MVEIYYLLCNDASSQPVEFYNLQRDCCNGPLGGYNDCKQANETANDTMKQSDVEASLYD